MAYYIDKDALVAKIERKQEEVSYCENGSFASWVDENYYFTLETVKNLIDTLDTLEVKGVDLEKEISFQWSKFCLSSKDKGSFVKVAKHFFELGMLVSNKAQKGE